jgi:hypothetical protein
MTENSTSGSGSIADAITEAITEYSVAAETNETTFGKLMDVAAECCFVTVGQPDTAEQYAANFDTHCYEAEVSYIRQTRHDVEFLPTYARGAKAGRIKTASYLPDTYKHARSTIYNALKDDIAIHDETGKLKGKSRLERDKRERKETATKEPKPVDIDKLTDKLIAAIISSADPERVRYDTVNRINAAVNKYLEMP